MRGVCGHDRVEHAVTGCAQCLHEEAAGQRPTATVCGRATPTGQSGPTKKGCAERLDYTRPWLTWTYRMTFACGAVALAGLVWLPEDGADAARAVAIGAALLATLGALAIGIHALAELARFLMNHFAEATRP